MDAARVSLGEKVAAGAGLLLFVSMLLPWYGGQETLELPGREVTAPATESLNAWESLAVLDLLLFLVAVLAVAMAAARATGDLPRDLPAPPGLILAAAGAVSLVLVLFRVLFAPDLEVATATGDLEASRRIGIFVAVVACAAIAWGGYTSFAERAGR